MIQLLNKELWEEKAILEKMYDDSFYYGHLGKHALSSSAAKKLIESPKAYAKSLRMSSDSQALRDGRLVHLSVLEPHRLNDLTVVEGTKASKAFKGAVEEYGKDMVYTESELNNANWIAKAVKECNEAWHLLDGCSFEKPAIKMLDGLAFRGKADAMKGKTIIDLKTTSGGLAKFKWSSKNFSYDLQAALYLHLFDADEFIFLVVDKDTKDIGIFECSGRFIQDGLDKVDKAIENYKHFFINTDPMESVRNYVTREML